MKIYKIKHIATGLFSVGGISPYFTKDGKGWTSLGKLRNHLGMFYQHTTNGISKVYGRLAYYPYNSPPVYWKDIEIVEYELIEQELSTNLTMEKELIGVVQRHKKKYGK